MIDINIIYIIDKSVRYVSVIFIHRFFFLESGSRSASSSSESSENKRSNRYIQWPACYGIIFMQYDGWNPSPPPEQKRKNELENSNRKNVLQ